MNCIVNSVINCFISAPAIIGASVGFEQIAVAEQECTNQNCIFQQLGLAIQAIAMGQILSVGLFFYKQIKRGVHNDSDKRTIILLTIFNLWNIAKIIKWIVYRVSNEVDLEAENNFLEKSFSLSSQAPTYLNRSIITTEFLEKRSFHGGGLILFDPRER